MANDFTARVAGISVELVLFWGRKETGYYS